MAEPSVQGRIHSVFWEASSNLRLPPRSARLQKLPIMAGFGRHLAFFKLFHQ